MTDPEATLVPLSWGPWLEAHPLAHIVYDAASLQVLAGNGAARARYGYGREEFLQLNRVDLLAPGQLPLLRRFLAGLPASATAEPQPVWLERTRDGRLMHADIRSLPVLMDGRAARLAVVLDAGSRTRLAADAAGARDLLEVAGRMAHLGGWRCDLQQRNFRWSDEVAAMHEVPAGTTCSFESALARYADGGDNPVAAALQRCAEEAAPFDLELPLAGARGTRCWVRMVGAAVRDGSGAVVAVEGAQQDITERHLAAAALAASRSRLQALLHAIPDLWFVLDAEGRHAEVSSVSHPDLPMPWESQQGLAIEAAMDAGHAATTRRLITAAHSSGQPQGWQYELATAGGVARSFDARCVALEGGRTLLLIRNITQAVQLEQRFRAMADAAPIAIYMTDPKGHCTYTNPAWQALYGLSLEGSLGRAWTGVLHPEDRQRVFDRLSAAAGAPCEIEFRLLPAGGAMRSVIGRASPIVGTDGTVTGHVGTVVDVTQARELEAARRDREVAMEAERRQAAFMSRVSHEMRTPLNAILGFGQLLQQASGLTPERSTAYATHVVVAGHHLLAMVDKLLELQRLEEGRLGVQRVAVDLQALLAACARLLESAATAAQFDLVLDVPAPLVVQSDERCLQQMVLNLGSNAIQYGRSTSGRSRLTMAARRVQDGVHLSVIDRGPGMSEAQVERLFRPFERLGQEARGQPGSGLGLVITRQLAQLLGAELAIETEPGQGTRATVRLPG